MGNRPPPSWDNAPFAGSAWVTNRDAQLAAGLLRQQSFGAIAYSPSTGRYGWAFRAPDQASAEQLAMENCGTNDAEVLVWGSNTHLVLALADDGAFGWAWDDDLKAATKRALAGCEGPNPRIVVSIDTRSG